MSGWLSALGTQLISKGLEGTQLISKGLEGTQLISLRDWRVQTYYENNSYDTKGCGARVCVWGQKCLVLVCFVCFTYDTFIMDLSLVDEVDILWEASVVKVYLLSVSAKCIFTSCLGKILPS